MSKKEAIAAAMHIILLGEDPDSPESEDISESIPSSKPASVSLAPEIVVQHRYLSRLQTWHAAVFHR
jgi:hypothetical protein